MKRVYKYEVPIQDQFALQLPVGAQVLTVQTQYGDAPRLWALVDADSAVTELRSFILRGTGHDIEEPVDRLIHCGTFQLQDGALVFHVFEVA